MASTQQGCCGFVSIRRRTGLYKLQILYYWAKPSAYALEKYNDRSVEKSLNSSGQLHFSFYLILARKIALINHVASAKTMVESLANLFSICLKLLNGIPCGERLGADCVANDTFARFV